MKKKERQKMNKEIAKVTPLSALQIREQVNLIQEVMREVMTDGQHYGKIPGCGDKPTLLKPGAEKLSMTFRLRPIIDNERDIRIEDLGRGHKDIHVYCHVYNMSGTEMATGIGSCSTMESKYRYRGGEKVSTGKPVPKDYWNLKKEGKFQEALEAIGGKGFGVAKVDGMWQICELGEKMENPDIADVYNTVLKMAKKRAYVDGILSATAASDIFTQDIEDLPPGFVKNGGSKPQVSEPHAKTEIVEPQPSQGAKNGDLEGLGMIAFNRNKGEFLGFLGTEFGVENLSELSEKQRAECVTKLNKIIKDGKK